MDPNEEEAKRLLAELIVQMLKTVLPPGPFHSGGIIKDLRPISPSNEYILPRKVKDVF